jgi:hypothetical protein
VRSSERLEEPATSTEQIRTNSVTYEAGLRFKDLNPTEDTATAVKEILQPLPLADKDKGIITRFDLSRKHILGHITSRETSKILQGRLEQDEDWYALGAAMNALESVYGPIENQDTTVEPWVDHGIRKAASKGIRIPREGSGQHPTTSKEEKREQNSKRQAKSRKRDREAREQLEQQMRAAINKIRYRHGQGSAYKEEAHAAKMKVLDDALRSDDPHVKNAAENLKKKLKR